MARRENSFKKYLIKIMGSSWDVQSHEDKFSLGIPDLSFGANGKNGWIELKQIKGYPANPETLMKPEHYTASQVNWIKRRGKKATNCFVLVKVADDYYLFHWVYAKHVRMGMTAGDYKTHCHGFWQGNIDPQELLTALTYDEYYSR